MRRRWPHPLSAIRKRSFAWHIAVDSFAHVRSTIAPLMTFISAAQNLARSTGKDWRGHLLPIASAGVIAVTAITLVAYLLWPTWEIDSASGPARLPVSIGGTLFNVPAASIRMKIQHHSGPQE